MTIQTETEQPALTYSKSKGLVTLVTGTEFWVQTFPVFFSTFGKAFSSFCFYCLCCSFYETEEDGAERLHSEARHKLLRLQAVSTV